MIMDIKRSINDTRKGFEESFAAGEFYNRQTQDSDHLEKILGFVKISERMKILDLGTGSGYLSFPIAKGNPDCDVIGLDIVNDALEANRMRATAEEIKNLSFVSYDGIDFPFESGSFDLVVTRYALHHFPDIVHSIGEVSRVLKNGGMLFISDPCPNECDTDRFVDDYMRLKKDGHIKFYTKDDWTDICCNQGLIILDSFESSIRFPKKKDTAFGYETVLMKHDKTVIDSYDLAETDTELYITERVNNILFMKEYNICGDGMNDYRDERMKIFPKSIDIGEYLRSSAVIDYMNESVSGLADTLFEKSGNNMDYIRRAYEYVRDRIPHSADIDAEEVPCTASEVLETGHGICFAKSHLLAALLRYKGIPTGFCYQKLILDDETASELIIHGLNGVYLEDRKTWIRLDARGNKEGVNARFSVTDEQLAFPIRPEKGERDGIMVYAGPAPDVIMALQSHNSRSELWIDLPTELPDSDVLITARLILRRWEDSDAEDLYKYASDPDVGPIAGWPPHRNIEESRDVIKNVLSGKEAYAICLKEDGKAIGAIELKLNDHTDMTDRDDECEMGYWLGKPFWGQGIMPEAVKEMLRHAFEDCGMQKVWIGYYEGNQKSKRVQEKCGFKYQWRSENVDVPLMHEKRTGHVSLMTKEDWEAAQIQKY